MLFAALRFRSFRRSFTSSSSFNMVLDKKTIRARIGTDIPTYTTYRKLIPPLEANLRKGQGGRVGIIGGSSDYTGAPFFSAMASLRMGADLCHVICDQDAATSIKSYSPDIIVHPYIKVAAVEANESNKAKVNEIMAQTFDDISLILSRLHVLVVGPGLSRNKYMLLCAGHAIEQAKAANMPIVIDADGLFFLQHNLDAIRDYTNAILTPNVVEFQRLCGATGVDADDENDYEIPAQRLSKALGGVTIVEKGAWDTISNGEKTYLVDNEGGMKRSGGQGDILTGILATSLAWSLAYEKKIWDHDGTVPIDEAHMAAIFGACVINREVSRLAYEKHWRALQASDVIAEIGPFFHQFSTSARPKASWEEAVYG